MRRNGNSQLIFHFPPVPSTQPPPWSEWSRETPAVLIKKSNEELQSLDSSFLSLSTSEDPTEFIKPRAHTSEHTRDRRCADPFLFIFFFSSTRPVPSGTLPAFYRTTQTPGHPFGIRCWSRLLLLLPFLSLLQQPPDEQIAAVFRDSAIGIYLLH